MSDYLTVVYDDKTRPYTGYPAKLARYLFDRFGMRPGMSMLEPGCGRGEVLKCFGELGLAVRGTDLSPETPKYLSGIPVDICDVEKDGLPFPDDSFDIVYSKSFLEHFHYPERYVREAFRVLKPGGLLLNLVPDWEVAYRKYFDDYTHRTPFTVISLQDIMRIHGFTDVTVDKFRQLPIVWKYPFLNMVCACIAPFVPLRHKGVLRWTWELMLIGAGKKPKRDGGAVC